MSRSRLVGASRWGNRDDLRSGAVVIAALAAIGAALGPLWIWWSPPGPLGLVVAKSSIQVDETETFAAVDGRYAVLTGAVGIVAGFVVWSMRRTRGPVLAASLAVGGLVGALCTEGVGRLIDTGSDSAPVNTVIRHLPLAVHATALRLLEPLLALLVYSVLTAFAADDDLGRPDPAAAAGDSGPSVGAGADLQHGGGDRDALGALYEPELPPQ